MSKINSYDENDAEQINDVDEEVLFDKVNKGVQVSMDEKSFAILGHKQSAP